MRVSLDMQTKANPFFVREIVNKILSHSHSSGVVSDPIAIRVEGLVTMNRPPDAGEILQGTLDMLVLRTLVLGAAHGHTIAQAIERSSENALEVEQGSLYPALHRLEDRGWVSSEWGMSENNRKAKFYRLTNKGRKELSAAEGRWRRMTRAIGLILGETFE